MYSAESSDKDAVRYSVLQSEFTSTPPLPITCTAKEILQSVQRGCARRAPENATARYFSS